MEQELERGQEPERFKLCIIDDIRSVVEMISRKPGWQEHGIEVSGTALDGEEGLRMIRETRPDIVLTDIRMPRMDGLQMTRAILDFLPDCKIIILSAYSEFTYAQEAIRLGALDFVKKPFSLDEIVNVVLKAKELCRQERQKTARLAVMESKIKESMPILRQEYLTFLLHHQTTEADARSRWAYLDIPLRSMISSCLSPRLIILRRSLWASLCRRSSCCGSACIIFSRRRFPPGPAG